MNTRVELETSVGYALKRAASALRAAMESALEPLDLTVSQYSCLELLGHTPGMSGSDLARGTFVTRQSMHALLRGLEDRGLLTRPESAPHGRALPTVLTPAGEQLVAEASTAVATVERTMMADLSPAARDGLLDALDSCVRALEAVPPTE